MILMLISYDELLTAIRWLCVSFRSNFNSTDWMLRITILSFFVSVFFTAKVYERKRRDLYIVCQNSSFNLKVASNLRDKIGDYVPPWWYNRHFGTMIPFGYNPNITYEREIFTEEDACFAVDWFPMKPDKLYIAGRTIKICVFYPGLGLGSQNVRYHSLFFIFSFIFVIYFYHTLFTIYMRISSSDQFFCCILYTSHFPHFSYISYF